MDSVARHILALHRRGVLRGGLALAALAAVTPPARGDERLGENPFTLGVASGEPRANSLILWTRLTDRIAPVPVTWEVAADERFGRIIRSGEAMALAEDGHSLHIEIAGLPPATTLHYRFRAGAHRSATGRSRTAPAPAADAALRFANAGCQHFEHGHFTAWRHIAEAPLDFVFHYGDYIYEYRGLGPADGGWAARARVRRHDGEETVTLADYRARHAQYRGDPDLQAAHAAHPFIVSYDDHEVANDWAGGAPATPAFALRRIAALKAWWEAMPVPRAMLGGPAYRRFRFGRHLALHALDTRAHRDAQPCGGRGACAAIDRPDAQMLGAAQEAWLGEGLAEARSTTWNLLAQQVPLMQRRLANNALSLDKWDGYPAARARLFAMLAARGIGGAVALSGDVHRALAATLHAAPGAPPIATEFTATSITSEGDGADTPADAPLLARNPLIAYLGSRRGFTLHEAAPAAFTASFRELPYVSRPGASAREAARFLVEPGRPALHRLSVSEGPGN